MRLLVVLIITVAAVTSTALADEEGSVKMTRDELLSFLPGSNVSRVKPNGGIDRWVNELDGTILVLSEHGKYGGIKGMIQVARHRGTWRINEDGEYCVKIEKRFDPDIWCAPILKTVNGYYLNEVEPRQRIEFVK